ncbi:MAG: M23 family metallopeptidase, partial [Oscillospiraceae bacterium]
PLLDVWDDGIGWEELSFTSPVDMPITGAYGSHISLDDGKQISRNSGIDITAPEGTEVLSPNAGRVLFAARLKLTGYTVVIEHGGGLKSFYYHLDDITINQGGMVERGTPIGTVGDTGTDEPPHLTMEMKIGNQSIDPVPLFRGVSAIYRKN